ncbi:MAG: hypothetical protein JNL21_07335 [Myxococcales bacterium]|nr:hypothetical protein [Myxococcales bacterium]
MREILIRVPEDMIARAETYAESMSRRTGLRVSRSDVCRMALLRLLDAEGVEDTAKPPREALRLHHGPDGSVLGPKAAKKAAKKPEIDPNADLDAMPNPFA